MAKAKIDSEALKKNSFWIGLGAFGLLWLTGVIVVLLAGDTTAKGKYEESKKGVEGAKSGRPKTAAYQTPWNDHGTVFRKHKDHVWQVAWNQQAEMYTWPENMPVLPQYPEDTWVSASDSDLNNRGKFRGLYPTQFTYLESAMQPVEMAGGVVGVMAPVVWVKERAPTREEIWLAQEDFLVRREMLSIVREAVNTVAYFRDVTAEVTSKEKPAGKGGDKPKEDGEDAEKKDAPPAKDKDKPAAKDKDKGKEVVPAKDGDKGAAKDGEAVKDKAAEKDKDKGKEAPKTKEPPKPAGPVGEKPSAANGFRRVYRNANWELDLRFEKKEGTNKWLLSSASTIKNVNVTQRTQPLANPKDNKGLGFRIYQGGSNFVLFVPGEPVSFGQSVPIKPEREGDVSPVQPQNAFSGIEQLLAWEMSPVRRIESIEVPYHSHRTITQGLKIREDLKKLDPDATEGDAAAGGNAVGGGGAGGAPAAGGGMAGGKGGPPPGMGGPPPGPGTGGDGKQADAAEVTSINKINRMRYLHVKEQARHLPVAMKLVVDQSHVHDVLSAFANSRLRIQITQVSLHYVRNVARDTDAPAGGKDKSKKRSEFSIPGMGMGAGKGGPPPPPGMGMGMGMGKGMGMPMGSGGGYGPPPGMGGGKGKDGGPAAPEQGTDVPVVQDTAQLVEVTVYGIASLYERFPPRPKPEAAAGGGQPAPK